MRGESEQGDLTLMGDPAYLLGLEHASGRLIIQRCVLEYYGEY